MPITLIGNTPIPGVARSRGKFRSVSMEVGFCFTIAATQFLAEYLISGFAVELPRLLKTSSSRSMGLFWPATLLSLVMSATLLTFARLSDMYGGYRFFVSGAIWLCIWTLVPGFSRDVVLLDISRAMQGLAIAAFTPSAYAMIGANYPEGPRRNMVMGLYSGCAPVGFFCGILVAGVLPASLPQWYFWIAAILSFITVMTAYMSVPHESEREYKMGLEVDYIGAFLITAGLILIAYALALEPYLNDPNGDERGFGKIKFLGPFLSGLGCLSVAIWIEGWVAKSPLLPFSFFRPRSAITLSLAGLFFYAAFGVWLYDSVEFLQSHTGTTTPDDPSGIILALWYLPTAVGGLVLCVVSSMALHIMPIQVLLIISGLSWVGAPLLLAVSPLPLDYWKATFPSMLCATLGIDMTYTITCVFFSAVQPLKFQGLSGAVCSILVNLAMSFSLPISEMVKGAAERGRSTETMADSTNWGYRAAFLYAVATAGVGLIIAVLFVRIPRQVVDRRPADEQSAVSSQPSIS
nr:putative mfs-type transporter [Quercus suber]